MKRKMVLYGVLVISMLFGVQIIACAQSTGGSFTVTDIPSKFNGKYVLVVAENYYNSVSILGGNYNPTNLVNLESQGGIFIRISNGSINVPVWLINSYMSIGMGQVPSEIARYNGNHTLNEVCVSIYNTNSATREIIAKFAFEEVKFTNGSAKVSFQDNFDFDEI